MPTRLRARRRTITPQPAEPDPPIPTDARRAEVTDAQLIAASATFDLLSVPGRLHLVWLLAAQELDVTTLADLTGAAIPATSQQLAKLRAAGVVTARRDGRRQLYRVNDPHIATVIDQMFSHIAPDGTLAPDPGRDRPPRRPRFTDPAAGAAGTPGDTAASVRSRGR